MTQSISLPVGRSVWPLTVRPEALLPLIRDASPPPAAGPRELVRAALEAPFGFDSPMRRAVTPDDRVAVVLDERLPHVAELLTAVLEHLGSAGIDPSAVTVVVPPGSSENAWIDDLPDEFADLTVEVHDVEAPQKMAYLATTRAGRRVYLNRTLLDADFAVVLTGRGFDPTAGHGGGEVAVFPALSNGETLAGFVGQFRTDPPAGEPNRLRREAAEVVWLLGTPFFVQVIQGPGDTVAEVVAGLPDSLEEGVRVQDSRWRASVADRPDLVVAAVSGDAARADFLAVASAVANAARVVQPGGRVAVLTEATPPLQEGAELLQSVEDPSAAAKVLAKRKPDDWPAAALWALAAKQAHLFVAAGWPDEVIEGLYATPVRSAAEVQRLIDAAGRVLILPDAQKTIVEVL